MDQPQLPAPEVSDPSRETLQKLHPDPRDSRITFVTEGHIYYVQVGNAIKIFTSVTTWNKGFFKEFDSKAVIAKMKASKKYAPGHKYWGMEDSAIEKQWETNRDQASGSGTSMHDRIELCLNLPVHSQQGQLLSVDHQSILHVHRLLEAPAETMLPEWKGFLNFASDYPTLIPYRTEWRIFHEELEIAGSIDIVYQDPELANGLILMDWKRAAEIKKENLFRERGLHWALFHIHDTNYWKYSLQLNVYKFILESKYGKKVTGMYLVQIHPDLKEARGYLLHVVPDLSKEVGLLVQSRLAEIGPR
jgi:hypothetical protein